MNPTSLEVYNIAAPKAQHTEPVSPHNFHPAFSEYACMLRRYTWESPKKKFLYYKRREPETSVLYQIVYYSRDDLEYQWESRFLHEYGVLQDEVTKTLDE